MALLAAPVTSAREVTFESALAEFFVATEVSDREKAARRLLKTEPEFSVILARLRTGRVYATDVETGRLDWSRKGSGGSVLPYVEAFRQEGAMVVFRARPGGHNTRWWNGERRRMEAPWSMRAVRATTPDQGPSKWGSTRSRTMDTPSKCRCSWGSTRPTEASPASSCCR